MKSSITGVLRHGRMWFVTCEVHDSCVKDPRLQGWFIDDNGIWTVALVIEDRLVFVRGEAHDRDGRPIR